MSTILTRPLAPEAERNYIYSCSQRSIAWGMGPHVHTPTVYRLVTELVDHILESGSVTVATLSDAPDLLGYVARGADGAIEIIYLRKALIETPQLAREVAKALLPGPMVVLRRVPPRRILTVLLEAGLSVSVVPAVI